jgi:hypothetical protein
LTTPIVVATYRMPGGARPGVRRRYNQRIDRDRPLDAPRAPPV